MEIDCNSLFLNTLSHFYATVAGFGPIKRMTGAIGAPPIVKTSGARTQSMERPPATPGVGRRRRGDNAMLILILAVTAVAVAVAVS